MAQIKASYLLWITGFLDLFLRNVNSHKALTTDSKLRTDARWTVNIWEKEPKLKWFEVIKEDQ